MADCEFVQIDGVWLPAVSGVTSTPEHLIDAERTIGGLLRVEHTSSPRSWAVTLTGVPGDELHDLLAHLRERVAPRHAVIMGESANVMVTIDSIRHRPKIQRGKSLSEAGDKLRADVTLTLREINRQGFEYQVFTADGVFDWVAAGSPARVDVLLVAGGGGGGSGTTTSPGGGGGAGGVMIYTGVPVAGDVAVVVGAGGAPDGLGFDSRFADYSARGGGPGVTGVLIPGGSGGGGRGTSGHPAQLGSPGIAPQGNAGGAGYPGGNRGAGGGGGFAEPGESASAALAGRGGDGVRLDALGWDAPGAPEVVAGGGGGGSSGLVERRHGGIGGGGSGGVSDSDGNAGAPNTGGGGGGGGRSSDGALPGGAGGSGLVIVRWPA